MDASFGIIGAVCGLIGVVSGLVGIFTSRRTAREANKTAETLAEFEILKGIVQELRAESARKSDEIRAIRRELLVERDNVQTLTRHIQEHVPMGVTFPRLRVVNGHGDRD